MGTSRRVEFDDVVFSKEALDLWGEILTGEKKMLNQGKRRSRRKKHEFERSAHIDKKGNLTIEIRLRGDHRVLAYFVVKAGDWKYWTLPRS